MHSFTLHAIVLIPFFAMCGCVPPDGAPQTARTTPAANQLAGTSWDLQQLTINGVASRPPAGCQPTLSVKASEILGNAGCNRFSGFYTEANGAFRIQELMMTEMGCPHLKFESTYSSALLSIDTCKVGNGQLTLSNSATGDTLVFAPHRSSNLPLRGIQWRLSCFTESDGVTDSATNVEGELTLTIAAEAKADSEPSARGFGGCNTFQGSAVVEGNTIQFSTIAATKKACAGNVMMQESKYFSTLQKMTRYQIRGNTLTLESADKTIGLQFEGAVADGDSQDRE